jgi:hypothetical protein
LTIPEIHYQFALSLYQKGDFEGSIANFIIARCKPSDVIALFPDFIPSSLFAAFSAIYGDVLSKNTSSGRLPGTAPHLLYPYANMPLFPMSLYPYAPISLCP